MSSFPNFSVCNDKAYILGMIFNTSLLFLAGWRLSLNLLKFLGPAY